MKKLKDLRLKRNLTISRLAELSNIPQKTLLRLENGEAKGISFKYLNRLCYVLDISNLNDLMESYSRTKN